MPLHLLALLPMSTPSHFPLSTKRIKWYPGCTGEELELMRLKVIPLIPTQLLQCILALGYARRSQDSWQLGKLLH